MPSTIYAQTIRGQVVDSTSGTPVGTGFVVLIGAGDTELARALTSARSSRLKPRDSNPWASRPRSALSSARRQTWTPQGLSG